MVSKLPLPLGCWILTKFASRLIKSPNLDLKLELVWTPQTIPILYSIKFPHDPISHFVTPSLHWINTYSATSFRYVAMPSQSVSDFVPIIRRTFKNECRDWWLWTCGCWPAFPTAQHLQSLSLARECFLLYVPSDTHNSHVNPCLKDSMSK